MISAVLHAYPWCRYFVTGVNACVCSWWSINEHASAAGFRKLLTASCFIKLSPPYSCPNPSLSPQSGQDMRSQETAGISGADCVVQILSDLVGETESRVEWRQHDQSKLNAYLCFLAHRRLLPDGRLTSEGKSSNCLGVSETSWLPYCVFCICLLTNENPNANKLCWVINYCGIPGTGTSHSV